MAESKRVLSIQSHVVRGYVGNKSATFPLQVLGYDVDAINSVQFSNHTHYKHVKGQVLTSSELEDLMYGLRNNQLLDYSHLLSGYVGDPTFLRKIKDVAQELKAGVNSTLKYVCDPVMGDNGKMYVPESILPVYQREIIQVADIILPNQYEAELLTGMKLTTMEEAVIVMKSLHSMGPSTVVISSASIDGKLCLFASQRAADGAFSGVTVEIPMIDAVFVGTGDLFAALLTANLNSHSLKESCIRVISTMQVILRKTLAHAQVLAGPGVKPTVEQLELRLVQCKADIENSPKLDLNVSDLNMQ